MRFGMIQPKSSTLEEGRQEKMQGQSDADSRSHMAGRPRSGDVSIFSKKEKEINSININFKQ
jgi:hypothetical protein